MPYPDYTKEDIAEFRKRNHMLTWGMAPWDCIKLMKEEHEEANRKEEIKKEEVAPETRLGNTVTGQIETAIEKLGRKNVFGPKEVEKTFNVRLIEAPEILFSIEELERAKKLGQMLILRVDKTEDGKPMSLKAMNAIFVKRWKTGVCLLNTVDGWQKAMEEKAFETVTPRSGWALVSKNLLPYSTNKNYIEQTEIIIKALRKKAFKDIEVPAEYAEAIAEFKSQKERLTKIIRKDWMEAAKQLSELKISQLTRASIQETIYDFAIYYDTHGKWLLPNRYTWSNSLAWFDHLIDLGSSGARGVIGYYLKPGDTYNNVGVSLSRRH